MNLFAPIPNNDPAAQGARPLADRMCPRTLEEFVGPVAIGLRSGHVVGQNRSLPLGAWVKMNDDTVEEIS